MKSQMKPKAWAVLSDALDEGCGHAVRRVLELSGVDFHGPLFGEMVAVAKHEILNAICERFSFDDDEVTR